MHGLTRAATAPLLSREIAGTRCRHRAWRHSHSNLINSGGGVISVERFTAARPRAPGGYRSLYLSRAISLQMGLKLMAFDTAVSSTSTSLGFMAAAFEKVEEGDGGRDWLLAPPPHQQEPSTKNLKLVPPWSAGPDVLALVCGENRRLWWDRAVNMKAATLIIPPGGAAPSSP